MATFLISKLQRFSDSAARRDLDFLFFSWIYQQRCPSPGHACPFRGAWLGAPLFPRGLGAELPFLQGKEVGQPGVPPA